jgi:hypothetical protein
MLDFYTTVRFWLFWIGVYDPKLEKEIKPVHVIFFLIIFEK